MKPKHTGTVATDYLIQSRIFRTSSVCLQFVFNTIDVHYPFASLLAFGRIWPQRHHSLQFDRTRCKYHESQVTIAENSGIRILRL